MSLLPKLLPKIRPFIEKAKHKVKTNFLSTTNTVIGILVGIFTLIVYGLDIKGKFSNPGTEKEKKDSIEIVYTKQKSHPIKSNDKPISKRDQKHNKKTIKPKKINYFNNKEFLLERNGIAIFIKSSNGNINSEFQNNLSNAFQSKNIQTSTSFFTNQSLPYFKNFYTANPNWLETIHIKTHVNTYLIGNIKINKSNSSEASDITIINISFQGKIVNIKSKKSLPITKQIRETSYQEFKAFEAAYNRLCKDIVTAFLNF